MTKITQAQKEAIKRVFGRGPIYKSGKSPDELAYAAGWKFTVKNDGADGNPVVAYWERPNMTTVYANSTDVVREMRLDEPMTYLQFRRTVSQGFDCLMVRWCGMWLGIEKDGYTHS